MGVGPNSKGMGMSEQPYDAAREREEIESRVAIFKATQARFEREREEYFVTTLENARGAQHNARHEFAQPPYWS